MSAFTALGDPTRRRILELLAEGEQSVGTLRAGLVADHPVSQPAVSQHLRVLRDSGLVTARADGNRRLYALDRAGLAEAAAWLDWLVDAPAPFAQPLDALDTEVARGRRAQSAAGRSAKPAAGHHRESRSAPDALPGAATGG